ncbi:hypothetical protein SRHO_G00307100 [Serrasalmus rhombeus]
MSPRPHWSTAPRTALIKKKTTPSSSRTTEGEKVETLNGRLFSPKPNINSLQVSYASPPARSPGTQKLNRGSLQSLQALNAAVLLREEEEKCT